MNYVKLLGKSFLFSIVSLLILTFMITILNFCNIIGEKTVNFLEILIPIFSLFLGGFLMGHGSSKKGWLEGIKYGLIFLIILALFNYLGLRNSFTVKYLFYYGILLISSVLGSMLGISLKKE